MKKYPWDKSEAELIHNELFQETAEHKYYLLGVAHGFYFIYKILNHYKDQNFTTPELMELVKGAGNDKDTNVYFNRLLKDLDRE